MKYFLYLLLLSSFCAQVDAGHFHYWCEKLGKNGTEVLLNSDIGEDQNELIADSITPKTRRLNGLEYIDLRPLESKIIESQTLFNLNTLCIDCAGMLTAYFLNFANVLLEKQQLE